MGTYEENLEALAPVIIKEAKRRGLKINATCKYCGEVFIKQEPEYVYNHSEVCTKRLDSLSDKD
jgi:hypothetical protein